MFRLVFTSLVAMFLATSAYADILGLRFAGDPQLTRVIIEVSAAETHRELLSVEGGQHSIVVELPASDLKLNVSEGPAGGGVKYFRWENGLLYLDLHGPMMIARVLDLPPAGRESNHRIVVDLSYVSPARFASAARKDQAQLSRIQAATLGGPAPKVLSSPRKLDAPAAKGRKYTIVIDAGHGGKDPGASHHGVVEKNVVLSAALMLRDILKKNKRYDVRLTRDDDRFIELEDRVTLARDWGADLFVSIHADAAANSKATGATVYTLSSKGQKRTEKMISQKKWELPIETGGDEVVTSILGDLVVRETKSNSFIFAENLHEQLGKVGPLLRTTPRSANFYVLLAPDVPAVLLEMGFLTNAADAKRINNSRERKKIMAATARAIDLYFSKQDLTYAAN